MCILPPIRALLKIIWLIFFYKSCGGLVAKSCPTLVTPWTIAYQEAVSTGFPRQECWSGSHNLLKGIFPTHWLRPRLLHCRWILYWQPPGKPSTWLYIFVVILLCFLTIFWLMWACSHPDALIPEVISSSLFLCWAYIMAWYIVIEQ